MNNAWSRFDDRKPVDSSYHKETRNNNCRAALNRSILRDILIEEREEIHKLDRI